MNLDKTNTPVSIEDVDPFIGVDGLVRLYAAHTILWVLSVLGQIRCRRTGPMDIEVTFR